MVSLGEISRLFFNSIQQRAWGATLQEVGPARSQHIKQKPF